MQVYNFSFWLHYLDLWQSLRSNFTLCLTKKELEQNPIEFETPHPLFDLSNPHLSLSYKARLLKLSLTGTQLPSRTDEASVFLSATQMKNLLWSRSHQISNDSPIAIRSHKESWDTTVNNQTGQIRPSPHFTLRIGQRVLNPMYDYLFDAYQVETSFNAISENKLPNLETQIRIWGNEIYPFRNASVEVDRHHLTVDENLATVGSAGIKTWRRDNKIISRVILNAVSQPYHFGTKLPSGFCSLDGV